MKRPKLVMGIDQFGETYHDLGPHPRKALLQRLGRKRAARMYEDTKDGRTFCVGYVCAGRWVRLFEVKRLELPR